MRRAVLYGRRVYHSGTRSYSSKSPDPPIIHIKNGTFYRRYPSGADEHASSNPATFPDLTFELPSSSADSQHWAIVGQSNTGKTTLLEILRGEHLCIPPTARSYPFLATDGIDDRHRSRARAIEYVGFEGDNGVTGQSTIRGAYMSARYESRREETDFSVLDYLRGDTELNPLDLQKHKKIIDPGLRKVIKDLKLKDLIGMPMENLSNGQRRRARIAKSLLGKPMMLLLDEPFLGLDPSTVSHLSNLLFRMAEAKAPRLVLALRPQDSLPEWITHVLRLGEHLRIASQGRREKDVSSAPHDASRHNYKGTIDIESFGYQRGLPILDIHGMVRAPVGPDSPALKRTREGIDKGVPTKLVSGDSSWSPALVESTPAKDILVSMQGVRVKYGEKTVLGDWKTNGMRDGLWLSVCRGQRWGVFGPNGSGKTTLLSMICSDHPQAYSQPIEIFGQTRLPQQGHPGISIFDIQARIGQSSPEIHAFFPKTLSLRQTLENAWADTFLGIPQLTYEIDEKVDACLRWFEAELNPSFDPATTVFIKGRRIGMGIPSPRSTEWAEEISFGEASFSAQRVALFLRAFIKKPDLVVLDEAFSGMDDYVRDKCMLFLTWGDTRSFRLAKFDGVVKRWVAKTPKSIMMDHKPVEGLAADQALICVSHVKEEVPGLVKQWMCLPEPGSRKPPRFGLLTTPLDSNESSWKRIWGM